MNEPLRPLLGGTEIKDNQFVATIERLIKCLGGKPNEDLSPSEYFHLSKRAIDLYVDALVDHRIDVLEKGLSFLSEARSISTSILSLVRERFPEETDAPKSWGLTWFERLSGKKIHSKFDDHGIEVDRYQMIRSYVYFRADTLVGIAGLYAHEHEPGKLTLGAGRLAVADQAQGTRSFLRIVVHILEIARNLVATRDGAPHNSNVEFLPTLLLFTSRSDDNISVRNLYSKIGFIPAGSELFYNGIPQTILTLDLSPNSQTWERVAHFRRILRMG